MDFDDLLLAVLRIAEDPTSYAGEDLRGRFRHVLVDEFQDVNQVQYRLVRAFCKSHDNLCVVGDDDQEHLPLARRRRPDRPRLPARFSARDGGEARAELPLDRGTSCGARSA